MLYGGGCAVAKGGSGVAAGLGKLGGAKAAGGGWAAATVFAGWGSKCRGRRSSLWFGSYLLVSLGQILGKDLDLALHRLNELLHSRGGSLLKDSLYPSSSGHHLLHGAAS